MNVELGDSKGASLLKLSQFLSQKADGEPLRRRGQGVKGAERLQGSRRAGMTHFVGVKQFFSSLLRQQEVYEVYTESHFS
jgi:hypothetical protein